jgi:hypothetical protein
LANTIGYKLNCQGGEDYAEQTGEDIISGAANESANMACCEHTDKSYQIAEQYSYNQSRCLSREGAFSEK